jgi:hypothetical protein
MHGLANAMMIAASLRSMGPGMLMPPQATRFDIQNWGQPIAPWRNPLDHDLLHRPQEATDKVWPGPYTGGAPLIPVASRNERDALRAFAIALDKKETQRHPAYRGPTPDGKGFTRDATWWPTIDSVSMVFVPNSWSPPTMVDSRREIQSNVGGMVVDVEPIGP